MGRRRHRGGRGSEAIHIRGFVEPCILLLLRDGPSHGYDLAQNLGQFGFADLDPSIVYRTLRSMEDAGLIFSEWEGMSSGPARRVYDLSPAGQQHLARWVQQIHHADSMLHRFVGIYEGNSRDDVGRHS